MTPDPDAKAIKACPGCGKKAHYVSAMGEHWVNCTGHSCWSGPIENNEADAISSWSRVAALSEENALLRAAIARALADSESGNGWGPDVTVCSYLRDALLGPKGKV